MPFNRALIISIVLAVVTFALILLIVLTIELNDSNSNYYSFLFIPLITAIGSAVTYYYSKNNNTVYIAQNEVGGGLQLDDSLKYRINNLIKAIRNSNKSEVNNIFNSFGWVSCGTQEDSAEFLRRLFGEEIKLIYEEGEENETYYILPNQNNDSFIIQDTESRIDDITTVYSEDPNDIINKNDFNIFGFALHSGTKNSGHYIAVVRYQNGWWECNDDSIIRLRKFSDENILNNLK